MDPIPSIIEVQRLYPDAHDLSRSHASDAGLDLKVYAPKGLTLFRGTRYTLPTGIAIALPPGWGAFVMGRSGHTVAGLTVYLGLIDSGYRGEIKVMADYEGVSEPYQLEHGARIAQLVPFRIPAVTLVETTMLPPSERGMGGFGSTGR